MAQLFDDPDKPGTNARERAIIQASLVLTRAPGAFAARDVLALREAGLPTWKSSTCCTRPRCSAGPTA